MNLNSHIYLDLFGDLHRKITNRSAAPKTQWSLPILASQIQLTLYFPATKGRYLAISISLIGERAAVMNTRSPYWLGGTTITHFATKLALKTRAPVLIAPFGQGGSSAFDWSDGFLASRHEKALEMMARKKLKPVVFFWHQGEMGAGTPTNHRLGNRMDITPEQKSTEAYEIFLKRIIDKTRESYPDTYFGIALASLCKGKPHEPIRRAQRSVASANSKNFISADSDMISGSGLRYDGCHISQVGSMKLSTEYYNSFLKEINENPKLSKTLFGG